MKDFSRLIRFIAFLAFVLYPLVRWIANETESLRVPVLESDRFLPGEHANTYERHWQDYYASRYEMDYSLSHASADSAQEKKLAMRFPTDWYDDHYTRYWGVIYQEMLEFEQHTVTAIADSLQMIQEAQQLNTYQFADAIVTFVQDIPYSFVHWEKSCAGEQKPCVTGQRFGLHTPTEFLYTLQGDCDTRALLLYGVLRHFGYDVRIAVSDAYEHAMIMVHMRSSGAFKWYKGKKYYFWETTYPGWKKGMLPPQCSELSKWHIVL